MSETKKTIEQVIGELVLQSGKTIQHESHLDEEHHKRYEGFSVLMSQYAPDIPMNRYGLIALELLAIEEAGFKIRYIANEENGKTKVVFYPKEMP